MAKFLKSNLGQGSLFGLLVTLISLIPLGWIPQAEAELWVQVDPSRDHHVSCVVFDPTKLNTQYIGNSCHGLYKSTDSGDNWAEANSGYSFTSSESCTPVCALAIDPLWPNTLYLAWSDLYRIDAAMVGLWKSTNGAQSWSRVQGGFTCSQILSLAIDPQNSNIVYAGSACGIFKSMDGGSNWRAVNQGLSERGIEALAVDPQNPAILYAGTPWGVFKSADRGENWSQASNEWTYGSVRGLIVDSQNTAILYAGTASGVFKSVDCGRTWVDMSSGLKEKSVKAMTMDPQEPGDLYLWTDSGVYKAQMGGAVAAGTSAGVQLGSVEIVNMSRGGSTPSVPPLIAINCGGPKYTDKNGIVYQEDNSTYFTGGQTYLTSVGISGTDDGPLYQSERFGNYIYKFKVANGNYTVVLKFAEIYESVARKRVFSVKIEGKEVITNLDIFAGAGKNTAYDVSIPVTVSDGELNIEFYSAKKDAKVNAILVMSSGSITQNDTSTSSVSLGSSLVSTSGSQTSTFSAGGASGVVTSSSLSGASAAMQLSEDSNPVDPTDPSNWGQFLSCSFDGAVACGPLSPIQTNYTADFQYLGKSGKEPDRGLKTSNNAGTNLLAYLIPADSQNPLRQQFELFGQSGTLSLWVKPLFDPANNGKPHVIFQMIRTDRQNNNAPDLQNRLLLLVRDKQLEFGSGCISNTSTGVCPDQYQAITLKKLDENVHEDEIDGIAGHYAWKEKEWYHVAIVWSTTGIMSLYVDGGLVAREPRYDKDKMFSELPDRFYLGSRFNGDYPFKGVIDDVRFFNKSLSDWHIQEIFKKDYYAQIAKGTIGLSKTGFGGKSGNEVEAGTWGTITITYTVPPEEKIEAGGGVKILRKHGIGNWEWAGPQTFPPLGPDGSIPPPHLHPYCLPGYTQAKLTLAAGNHGNPVGQVNCIPIGLRLGSAKDCTYRLNSGALLPGDRIEFTFGDSQAKCPHPDITNINGTPNYYRAGFSAAENDNTQFTISVNRGGDNGGLYYELDPSAHKKLRVVSSRVDKLAVIAPSNAEKSGRFSFVVVAEDKYRNPVKDYIGNISVSLEPAVGSGPGNPIATYPFTSAENGHHRFVLDNFNFGSEGQYVLKVQDGTRTAYSNVIYASSNNTGLKLYWGDLHAHTQKSDGFISNDDTYKFMRDVANLDFAAMADHIVNPGDVYNSMDFGNLPGRYTSSGQVGIDWQDIIQTANKYYKIEDDKTDKTFVTFPGYEYSQGKSGKVVPCLRRNLGVTRDEVKAFPWDPGQWSVNEQKYNAYWSPAVPGWPYPDPPHPRWPSNSPENIGYWACNQRPEIANISCPEFDGDWNVYFSGTTADFDETIDGVKAGKTFWTPNSFAELVNSAKSWDKNENSGQVLIIPHHGGRQANIDLITSIPEARSLVPAVEITSSHIMAPCSFEAWANQALKNGAKIGFLASSDNHYGTAGKVPGGFIGVWATGLSRQEIFDAIKARRIVAASRQDRPYIRTTLKIGDQIIGEMGEGNATIPINLSYRTRLEIEVGSFGGTEKVQILQNEQVVAELGSRTENFFKVVYPTDFPNGKVDFSVNSRIYVKVIQKAETHTGEAPKAEGVAWSSPIFITVTGANAPVNSITWAGPVTYVEVKPYVERKPRVTVTLKLNPMPMKTLGGETARYVVKMFGTDSPNTPEATLAAMIASPETTLKNPSPNPGCSATVPTGGKVYCIERFDVDPDPNTGEISLPYIFNSTFTGDRYIWAVVHNDAIHSAGNLWAPYSLNSAWSFPVHSGPVNLSTAAGTSSTTTAAAGITDSVSSQGSITANRER